MGEYNKLKEISKNEYLYYFSKLKNNKSIDIKQYSDKYFKLNNSYVGLQFQKGNIIQLNGLFSLKKGDGKILLEYLIKKYKNKKHLRLNCNNKKL